MGISDRAFARMHDAYLEPPDEDFDDSEPDEMDLASIRKQEQRDREDFEAEKLRQKKEEAEWPTTADIEAANAEYLYTLRAAAEQEIFWEEEARARKAQR